ILLRLAELLDRAPRLAIGRQRAEVNLGLVGGVEIVPHEPDRPIGADGKAGVEDRWAGEAVDQAPRRECPTPILRPGVVDAGLVWRATGRKPRDVALPLPILPDRRPGVRALRDLPAVV